MRFPRDTRAKLLALAAALACAAPAAAQGTIAGQVVDGASGRPVAGAAVQLGTAPRVLADAEGRFTIPRVAPSLYDAVVSRLGYHPQAERWTVPGGDTLRVTVRMAAEEAALAQLRELAIAEFEASRERYGGDRLVRAVVGTPRVRAVVFRAPDLERSTAPNVAELIRSHGGLVLAVCPPRAGSRRYATLGGMGANRASGPDYSGARGCVHSAGRIVPLVVSVDGLAAGGLRGVELLPLHKVARVEVAQGSFVTVHTRDYFDRMARNGMVPPKP